jgi:hypothetical protein
MPCPALPSFILAVRWNRAVKNSRNEVHCTQGSHGLEKFWNSEKKFKGLEKVWTSVISLIKSGKSLENCHIVKKCTTVVIQEP